MATLSRWLLVLAVFSGCAAKKNYVTGTTIEQTDSNKTVLAACEEYRLAVERQDTDSIMLMAHEQYWEDSGTPSGSDDYGYEGLRQVLMSRLMKAKDIRFSVRYVNVSQQCTGEITVGCRAAVDVLVDASYTIQNVQGKEVRPDKRDQNQYVLEWDGRRWKFLTGM
jgi:hypothetical protein